MKPPPIHLLLKAVCEYESEGASCGLSQCSRRTPEVAFKYSICSVAQQQVFGPPSSYPFTDLGHRNISALGRSYNAAIFSCPNLFVLLAAGWAARPHCLPKYQGYEWARINLKYPRQTPLQVFLVPLSPLTETFESSDGFICGTHH